MALFSLYATILPCICQPRTCMAGFDMTSLLKRHIDIQISYSFSRQWSASGETSIVFKGRPTSLSHIEQEHKEEFGITSHTYDSFSSNHASMLIYYWPEEAFKGISLAFGVQAAYKSIHPLAQVGYTFHIWNGISISSSLRAIFDSTSNGTATSTDNIRIGINYAF